MTPPIQSANSNNPAPAPAESPEVQTARQAYDQAGYARNRAEQAHKQAVKDYGEGSPEAKAAKAELDKAQAEVEAKGKELSKALHLKPASAPKAAPKPAAKPAPKPAPKNPSETESGEKTQAFLERFESKRVFLESSRRVRTFEVLEREIRLFDEKGMKDRIQKIPEEYKKNPKGSEVLEILRHNGESVRMLEIPKRPKKVEQPNQEQQPPKTEPNS